jgi:hypothetical protein
MQNWKKKKITEKNLYPSLFNRRVKHNNSGEDENDRKEPLLFSL